MSDTKANHTHHDTRAPRGSFRNPGGRPRPTARKRSGHHPRDGDGPRPHRSRRHERGTSGTARVRRVRAEEVLPMGPATSGGGSYRSLFRRALEVAVDGGASLGLARSRATLATWDVCGASSHEEAERWRVEAFAAFLADRGEAHPMRAGVAARYSTPHPDDVEPEDDEERLQVPRARALAGDKVRRGGKR